MSFRIKHFFSLLIFLINFCTAGSVFAAESKSNPFKVENIYVSEKTGDLVDSQSLAISNGSREALSQLILNLNADSNKTAIDKCLTKFKDIDSLVASYSVNSERMTSKSYSAYINFTFNQQDVESVMNSCGLSYASVSPGVTLFIPLTFDGTRYSMINNEENPALFNIISNLGENFKLLKLKILYTANLFDMTEFDTQMIAQGTYEKTRDLLRAYECLSALIVIVESINSQSVVLNVKMLTKSEEYHDTLKYERQSRESEEMFIKRAVFSMLKDVDAVWKRGFKDQTENVFSSGVIVEMQNPSDWGKINRTLSTINIIKQYRFKTISNNAVELELKYLDSPIALSQKLYDNGIAIFKRGDKTVMKLVKN